MSHLLKKSLMMLALVATFAVAQVGTAVGQQSQAVVDIGTGEIILELGDTFIQVIGIETVDGANVFDTTAVDVTSGLGSPQQLDPNGIGWLSLSPFPAGTFNFGAILDQPFRNLDGIETLQVRLGFAGSAGIVLNVANGGITVINSAIPEPGSLSLLSLAGLGVVARRRR